MARARGSRNDLVSATRVNRSSEIGAREQKIQPPLQKSCDGGCDFYFVSDASIHTLIIVEALAHHFIHHNATGYRYIEGVDITELWDFDESIAQFHHLARDAFAF